MLIEAFFSVLLIQDKINDFSLASMLEVSFGVLVE
jgi:hypothetical protein